jgi:uncharacterized damage-inducible protein DinB
MSDLRTEQAAREAESWAAFAGALERIPRERWEEEGILPGWSVKELLWHMAGWLQKCARNLERFARGEDEPASEQSVDERNEELAAQAHGMTIDAVYRGLTSARELVVEGWNALPNVDERAVEELADETYDHYDEHRADLERFSAPA